MTLKEVIAGTVEKSKIETLSLYNVTGSYFQMHISTLCVTGMFSVFDSAYRSTFGFANVPSLVAMTFIKPVQININSSAT